MDPIKFHSTKFTSELVEENSFQAVPLGPHDVTLDFWQQKGDLRNGTIEVEMDIPDLDETEHIGLWIENGALVDYDGVYSLPKEVAAELEKLGITVTEDFKH